MRNLLSTVRLEQITPFHVNLLQQLEQTDFVPVRRKVVRDLAAQGRIPKEEDLNEGILALQQYYAIGVLDPQNMHAVSDAVDPFWHAHILHTREYAAFCDKLVGGYLHHDPLDHEKPRDVAFVSGLYRYTSQCYRRFFHYVNPAFLPEDLPNQRLVCVHMDITYSEELQRQGLLPRNPAMQASAAMS